MTKGQFETWLISKGYTKDTYGHYQKRLPISGVRMRMKLQATSVRYEKQVKIVDHNEWMRITAGYYSNLSITPEGNLSGMKR